MKHHKVVSSGVKPIDLRICLTVSNVLPSVMYIYFGTIMDTTSLTTPISNGGCGQR